MSGGEALLIMNPRARRSTRKRRTSYKRKRSTSRRTRSRRSYRVKRVRRNPRRRTYRARSYTRRRSRRRSYRVTRVRRNPSRVRSYIGGKARGFGSFLKQQVIPSAIGAGGALAVDLAWPYVQPYAPALLTGALAPVTRIGLAFGIGFVGRMVGGRTFGNEVMNGAITVTLYDLIKGYAVAAEPSLFGQPGASQAPTSRAASNYGGGYGNQYGGGYGASYNAYGGNSSYGGTYGSGSQSLGWYSRGVGWYSPAKQVGRYV